MASIKLNGEVVHLQPQAREDFLKLSQVVYANMKEERGVDAIIAQVLFDARSKDQPLESNVVQTCLWALSDLGVRDLSLNLEEKKIEVREAEVTDMRRGDCRAYGTANIESGRAYIGALSNVQQRRVRINGEIVRAFPQPKEEVEKVIKQIEANRLLNEDILFTAIRAIGAFIQQGKNMESAEYRAAVEIAAGLGVAEIVIDTANNKLILRGLNEHNAAAMVLLQGGDHAKVQLVRERLRKLAEKMQELAGQAREQEKANPAPIAIPGVVGSRRGKRRGS